MTLRREVNERVMAEALRAVVVAGVDEKVPPRTCMRIFLQAIWWTADRYGLDYRSFLNKAWAAEAKSEQRP